MSRTYSIKPHQTKLLKLVKRLPRERLNYLVVQQSSKHSNLTLNELKKHIKRGVSNYIKDLYGYKYKIGMENEVIKYICFFETSKEFFWSQHLNNIVDEQIEMKLHFHLFISSNNNFVTFSQLMQYIIRELLSQKNKPHSLNKIDYCKVEKLDDDFILYHTKQMMFLPNSEMMIYNV